MFCKQKVICQKPQRAYYQAYVEISIARAAAPGLNDHVNMSHQHALFIQTDEDAQFLFPLKYRWEFVREHTSCKDVDDDPVPTDRVSLSRNR